MTEPLRFEPLFFKDRLTTINPFGTIGIITLWSRVDYVLNRLEAAGVDLDPETSPAAVAGTLYGNGLRELLRNLLFNPQIDTLAVIGRNRSGSADELAAFFKGGLEAHDSGFTSYEAEPGLAAPESMRIRGTSRIIDSLVLPRSFKRSPRLVFLGNAQNGADIEKAFEFFKNYTPDRGPIPERVTIPLARIRVLNHPSNPRQHTIVESDPLSAWKELIFRLHRFGIPVELSKGERRELQNVKIAVEDPEKFDFDEIERYGFSRAHLESYAQDILSKALQADETYTYGNRMRAWFGLDSLEAAIERLKKDPQDRKSYIALWDARRDLVSEKGHPCLVSLFFRKLQEKLTLTASFRTHNALDAWLVNFFGLKAVQAYAAERTQMSPGAITIFSHSLTLDTRQMDRAALIAAEARFRYREDPMGYFKITLEKDSIFVEHRLGDITLKSYSHSKASHIQQELYRDLAVSDISHAIYLGRQLARAEMCLQSGRKFIQE